MNEVRDFINKYGITMSLQGVSSNPAFSGNPTMVNHYKITLFNPLTKRKLVTPFSTGKGWTEDPKIDDVLETLASGANSADIHETLEDFAYDFGYDLEDSQERKRVQKIYKAIKKEGENLKNFLTEEQYAELIYGEIPEDEEGEATAMRLTSRKTARKDYQGLKNYYTWFLKQLLENDHDLYQETIKIMRETKSLQDFIAWMKKNIFRFLSPVEKFEGMFSAAAKDSIPGFDKHNFPDTDSGYAKLLNYLAKHKNDLIDFLMDEIDFREIAESFFEDVEFEEGAGEGAATYRRAVRSAAKDVDGFSDWYTANVALTYANDSKLSGLMMREVKKQGTREKLTRHLKANLAGWIYKGFLGDEIKESFFDQAKEDGASGRGQSVYQFAVDQMHVEEISDFFFEKYEEQQRFENEGAAASYRSLKIANGEITEDSVRRTFESAGYEVAKVTVDNSHPEDGGGIDIRLRVDPAWDWGDGESIAGEVDDVTQVLRFIDKTWSHLEIAEWGQSMDDDEIFYVQFYDPEGPIGGKSSHRKSYSGSVKEYTGYPLDEIALTRGVEALGYEVDSVKYEREIDLYAIEVVKNDKFEKDGLKDLMQFVEEELGLFVADTNSRTDYPYVEFYGTEEIEAEEDDGTPSPLASRSLSVVKSHADTPHEGYTNIYTYAFIRAYEDSKKLGAIAMRTAAGYETQKALAQHISDNILAWLDQTDMANIAERLVNYATDDEETGTKEEKLEYAVDQINYTEVAKAWMDMEGDE